VVVIVVISVCVLKRETPRGDETGGASPCGHTESDESLAEW